MSQVLCVHCQHPIEDGAPRRGNLVTCPSCKGQVYVPQVQYVATFEEKQAAARAAAQQKAGSRTYKPSGKRASAVNANGIGVTFIMLAILIIGGAGLAVGGYFVFKAIKGHQDARVEMATSMYDFEKQKQPLIANPHPPGSGTAAGVATPNSRPLGNNPTREDLEKLAKVFQALEETAARLDKDYLKELEKTGINKLLAADRIATDTDFSQSRKIIAAAREVMARHREIAEMEDAAFLQDLAKLKLEGVPTDVMVGRIRAITEASQPEVDKVRSMDSVIAAQYEEAIDLLEATRGGWKLEGESVVFNDIKHAERYKTFFVEVDKCEQLKVDLKNKIEQASSPKWKAAIGLVN
ncbi:hypothetical protein [Roseimicrobium sp. ORNL1]|uniref:hypothetical protein n=1 Tax=Roseimicrobium sp. ORNL1 TaxID=2711231 RepID=UPI0013E0F3F7|nr:hypothetical protein [Roseimicrobium sp. ORNL1]QIF03603.1 hypothetical protein G5S37_19440 [Roseimicrobium sp. ORNL1]